MKKFSKNLGSSSKVLEASRVKRRSFTLRSHKYLAPPYKISSLGRPGDRNLCIPFIWFRSSIRCVIYANEIYLFLEVLISNVFLGEWRSSVDSCNPFKLLFFLLFILFIIISKSFLLTCCRYQ